MNVIQKVSKWRNERHLTCKQTMQQKSFDKQASGECHMISK